MSATVLQFGNVNTSKPGAYTKVNRQGLDVQPPGSIGVIAILGTSVGGLPVAFMTGPSDAPSFSRAGQITDYFRGGDLREGGVIACSPMKENAIAAPSKVYLLKVDPSTSAALTLINAQGNSVVLTSRDYGPHANQVNVSIAAGTVRGRLITVQFESITNSQDNIGGAAFGTIQYTTPPGGFGWAAMTIDVLAGGVRANGTKSNIGRSADLLNVPGNLVVQIVSTNVGDTTQTVSVYGLVAGIPTVRAIRLNGTTTVVDTVAFDANAIYGATISATALGTVSIQQAGPTNILQIAIGARASGGLFTQGMFVANTSLNFVADAASTAHVFVAGRNAVGTAILEVVILNGTTIVPTATTTWAQIDFVGLALVPAARTVTITGAAVQSDNTVQTDLLKLRDLFNARQVTVASVVYGFLFTLATTRTSFAPSQLDLTVPGSPVNAFNPATASLNADLQQVIEFFNSTQLVSAVASVGAIGAPANTTSPLYLAGGAAVAPNNANWQAAFDMLRQLDVNTIVPLSGDPNIHQMLVTHNQYMRNAGRKERDGIVGLENNALTDVPSFTTLQSLIVALNDHDVRAVAEAITRTDSFGNQREFLPPFFAALIAGAQAGSAIQVSLTGKTINAQKTRRDASWNPLDNANDAIQAGLLFTETTSVGIQVVRNVTTAVASLSIADTDAAVNRAVNTAVRKIRDDLDRAKGEPGFAGTRNVWLGKATESLNSMIGGALVAWRNLSISFLADQAIVSVDLAPVIFLNFIPTTINLYIQPITG